MTWNDSSFKAGPTLVASRPPARSSGPEVPPPRWDDGLVHGWTLAQRRRSVGWALIMLATFAAIPLALFALCWGLAQLSNLAAVVLAGILTVFFLARYAVEVVRAMLGERVSVVARAMASNRFLLATCALGGWAFLMAADTPGLGRLFAADASLPSLSGWLGFLGSEIADMALFDIPEALGWTESPIGPRSTLTIWALGGFRLLFGLGIVELAARLWQRFVSGATFYATLPDAWGRCAADLDPEAVLTWHGAIVPEPTVITCRVGDFVSSFRSEAESSTEVRALDAREQA